MGCNQGSADLYAGTFTKASMPAFSTIGKGGAGCRNRTRDIEFTKLALYQLS